MTAVMRESRMPVPLNCRPMLLAILPHPGSLNGRLLFSAYEPTSRKLPRCPCAGNNATGVGREVGIDAEGQQVLHCLHSLLGFPQAARFPMNSAGAATMNLA